MSERPWANHKLKFRSPAVGETLGNAHHHHHDQQQREPGRKGYQRYCVSASYRKMFSLVKEMSIYWETSKFHRGKRDADLKYDTDILRIPYYRREAISTLVLLRRDFSYISHAKIPVKVGLTKRQEKTYHILGSWRSTSLTLTIYSRQTHPVASRRGKPFPAISQADTPTPEPHSRDLLLLLPHDTQPVFTDMAETLLASCYNLCIYFQKTN